MEKRRTNFMKCAATLVMALAVALTAVLTPLTVKAASADAPFVVSSYTMAKGEKWTLNVYNTAKNAKVSYKTSKKSVATVSKKGVVAAKKPGSATITVTIKQGKDTYSGKVKIKVKKAITYAEAIKRVNTELNLLYVNAVALAEANGWLDDADAVEYLAACADVVKDANKMAKKANSYSEQDILDELEAIEAMAETMQELLPVFAQPYA